MSEFDKISVQQQEQIINSSLALMRDLTESYGPERGMELWDKIGDTVGKDVKERLFFGMISGKYSFNGVLFTKANVGKQVDAIKAIRRATGSSLKEAKETYDFVRDNGPKRIDCKGQARQELIEALRRYGHEVY